MGQYNNYVYFQDYLEELYIKEETHKCPDCGSDLMLRCEMRVGKNETQYLDEIWICPNCR